MEEEIDLRQYIEVLLRYKYWIIACTLIAAITAFVVSTFIPPTYEAEASLAMLRVRSEVAFEPKFKTISEEELSPKIDLKARREALVTLAESSAVASAVFQNYRERLTGVAGRIEDLMGMVEVESKGDLILIKVRSKDPELAAEIANAWAREAEKHINAIYGQPSQPVVEIKTQFEEAKTKYENAQKALEEFIAENRIAFLNRRISELEEARDKLHKQLLAVIDLHLGKQLDMVKGQADDYFNALLEQRQAVFNEQKSEKLEKLAYYYNRKQSLEKLLIQAEALRAQLQTATSVPGEIGDALAVLRARAGVFGIAEQAGVLDLRLENLSGLRDNPQSYIADLDELIEGIKAERDKASQEADKLAQELLQGEGYEYLGVVPPSSAPLFQAAVERLDAMLDLELPSELLPNYKGRPLYEKIEEIDAQIRQLKSQLEAEQARKRELESKRDLAWETYQTIARKLAEVEIAERAPGTEVRFAVEALPPERPVSPRRLMNTAVAGALGLMLGVVGAFFAEYWRESGEVGAVSPASSPS